MYLACFNGQGKKSCEPQSEHSLDHLDMGVIEQNIKKSELRIGVVLCRENY